MPPTLMAEGIQVVASFVQGGHSRQALELFSNMPFPNLLTLHDAPTVAEQKLFVMYLEHRKRPFQGTFPANPITLYGTAGVRCREI
jgi:hydroxylamine dehydrogenase